MTISGMDHARSLAAGAITQLKMVFNSSGAIFFPVSEQHRDQKTPGISYGDDYTGNALAAMLSLGKLDVRFHRDFSDARVAHLISSLLKTPELSFMTGWEITYQNRKLIIDR